MNCNIAHTQQILHLDHHPDARKQTATLLEKSGFQVVVAVNTQEALRFIQRRGLPHLAVVDWQSGSSFCQQIRQLSDLPMVVLTAVANRTHIAEIIETCADDCLVKPYHDQELIARIKRILHRVLDFSYVSHHVLQIGSLRLNLADNELIIGEYTYAMTPTETKILDVLLRHSGQFVPTQVLTQAIWPSPSTHVTDSRLHVHMHRIRNKLKHSPERFIHLSSTHLQGYRLDVGV